MVRIYTLTLAPSLDSATITPQIYPEGKLRCTSPVFETGGGGVRKERKVGSSTRLGGLELQLDFIGKKRDEFGVRGLSAGV